jgi:hypothetical protein
MLICDVSPLKNKIYRTYLRRNYLFDNSPCLGLCRSSCGVCVDRFHAVLRVVHRASAFATYRRVVHYIHPVGVILPFLSPQELTVLLPLSCCEVTWCPRYARIFVLSFKTLTTIWTGRLANEACLADTLSALVSMSRRRTRVVCCKLILQRIHGSADCKFCNSKTFFAPVQHTDEKVPASLCARDVKSAPKAAYCASYSALSVTVMVLRKLMSLEIGSSICLLFSSVRTASRIACAAAKSSVLITI